MAKITALPILGDPDGTELLPIVRDNRTFRAPIAPIIDQGVARAVVPHVAAAQLAAESALAAGRYFSSLADGQAASQVDQSFCTDDGAGSLVYHRRTAEGSVEIGRSVTPASLAASDGARRIGSRCNAIGSQPRTVDDRFEDTLSVFEFMTKAQIASVRARDLVADVTIPFQLGVNEAAARGAKLLAPAGSYRFTNSIIPPVTLLSFGLVGQNGNSTRFYFDNDVPLKPMFLIGGDVNYFSISDIECIDMKPLTSRGFHLQDDRSSTASPSWKHLFHNVRITLFREGARFDGGPTAQDDAHESEVMFLHSKFRNCETGLIYNNTQAVNHQLIATDFEDDLPAITGAHICMERGSTINHLGGSVIGTGSYLSFRYSEPAGFANTSQFVSRGIRVEKRGGSAPIIDHDPTSSITMSNALRIVIENMPVVATDADVFARLGGRVYAEFNNVHANNQMYVDAYMTPNLGANGEYGSIALQRCKAIDYRRVVDKPAYGSTTLVAANDLRGIPADISKVVEGAPGAMVGDYYDLRNVAQTVYQGGWQVAQMKTMVYSGGSTSGFGAGDNPAVAQAKLPRFARPCRFRLLRDDVNAGSPFKLELVFVVAGVDYLVASITPNPYYGGHFSAEITSLDALVYWIADGTSWDGKFKVVKSGTINGFVGQICIDYM